MKSKTNKLGLNPVLASSLLAANIPAFAITGDTDQPIHIESNQRFLDMQGNVVTFISSAIVTQGAIKISANKAVVTRPGGGQDKKVVDDYGKPATFYQMQDNGRPVEGHAPQMHYELAKDFAVLVGNAYLQQADSNTKGSKIACLVREQKTQAFGSKDKRVATVLVPSQLQDKSNKGQTPAQRKGS